MSVGVSSVTWRGAVVVFGIVIGLRGAIFIARFKERAILFQVSVCGYNNAVIGMRFGNLVCPCKHGILCAKVEAEHKVINAADLEGVVNVFNSAFFVVAFNLRGIALMIGKILVKVFYAVMSRSADQIVKIL